MAQAPSFRSRIAASAAALGLLFALGCSGGGGGSSAASTTPTGTIQGNITYTRIPLLKDSNGVPTGLETNPANYLTLPARGLTVEAFQHDTSNGADRWVIRTAAYTDASGHYSLSLPAGDGYIIQIRSVVRGNQGQTSGLTLTADPNGFSSLLPATQRPGYLLRTAPDGTTATPPSNVTPTATVSPNSTSTVNFSVDLSTKWLIGRTDLGADASSPGFTSATFESTATGSRPLAILDSTYSFLSTYGAPSPSLPLDLNYVMGRSESEGTYIEFNQRRWIQPGPGGVDLAYDGRLLTDHCLGSIRGAGANDDAWDEAVLFQLLSRSFVFNQTKALNYGLVPFAPLPVGAPIDGLTPEAAMVEGLPFVMAANLLKSPYLPDTDGTSALIGPPLDVRDISGVAAGDIGPYSSRTLAAMLWQINLKANGITTPPPETPAEWATINPAAITRLFNLSVPFDTTTALKPYMPANIYFQLALLKNAKSSTEPVDLAAVFTDTAINTITQPFNLPWPQPATTVFGQAWTSTTGGTYSYSGTLSMASDHQVNGVYANESYQEIAYLGVSQVNDQKYNLTLQTTPASLPAGATIQVVVFGINQAQTFPGTSASPLTFTLPGNGNATTPAQYPIMVRLLSPNTLQSDIPFTLQLAPAPAGSLRGPVPVH